MTDEVAAPGAARQLRAERPAGQRPRAGARDAAACTSGSSSSSRSAVTSTARSSSCRATPRSRGAAGRPRADVAGVLGPRRLRQALPREPAHRRHCPTTRGSHDDSARVLPEGVASGTPTGSPRTRCAARSSPLAGQHDGQPRRHHLRLPGGRGDGATPEQVARAYVVCREVFDLPRFVARRGGARQRRCPTSAQTALYLEFRRLSTARCGGSSLPARRSLDIAGRGRALPPGIEALLPAGSPDMLPGQRARPPAARARSSSRQGCARGARARRRRPCSTSTRCSTASRSPRTPGRGSTTSRRSTS